MIAVWPIDPDLPVIGLSGILVIAQMVMKAIVPAIPIHSHTLPQLLIVGIAQNIWAKPPTRKRIVALKLLAGTIFKL
jgi:hypothetical protein